MKNLREKAIKRYLRGANWMVRTGLVNIPENPIIVQKGLINRQNRCSLLLERNWKTNYMRK